MSDVGRGHTTTPPAVANQQPAGSGIVDVFNELVSTGQVYDLSHEIGVTTPIFPFHVPYSLALHRRHGDTIRPGNASFTNEMIVMPAHLSTHIDAVGHFSLDGKVYGGKDAAQIETHEGLSELDIAITPPVWTRGVLLDVARHVGVDCMEAGQAISASMLEECCAASGVELRPDDVVLVRTGWSRQWGDHPTFNGQRGGYPGVDPDGARWLIERQPRMVGSDTPAFEVAPTTGTSVHAMLLAENAINIIENLNLEQLSDDRIASFLFIALPLRMVGATASPVRPLALV